VDHESNKIPQIFSTNYSEIFIHLGHLRAKRPAGDGSGG
jgi:hypothetical protein